MWVGLPLGMAVLDSIRKQAEPVTRSKSVSSTLPWTLHQPRPLGSAGFWSSCLGFSQWSITQDIVSQLNPFLPKLSWTQCFIPAIGTLTKTDVCQPLLHTQIPRGPLRLVFVPTASRGWWFSPADPADEILRNGGLESIRY